MSGDGQADTFGLRDRSEEHRRAYQANLDEISAVSLLPLDLGDGFIGGGGVERRQYASWHH
jgi:hypothetical protein